MDTIKEALTFDDVLLLPKYSDVLPSKTNIILQLTKNISLKVPFITSAMDTVTESKMAMAIAKEGGLGIIHRNLDIKKQSIEVKKVKNNSEIKMTPIPNSRKTVPFGEIEIFFNASVGTLLTNSIATSIVK